MLYGINTFYNRIKITNLPHDYYLILRACYIFCKPSAIDHMLSFFRVLFLLKFKLGHNIAFSARSYTPFGSISFLQTDYIEQLLTKL